MYLPYTVESGMVVDYQPFFTKPLWTMRCIDMHKCALFTPSLRVFNKYVPNLVRLERLDEIPPFFPRFGCAFERTCVASLPRIWHENQLEQWAETRLVNNLNELQKAMTSVKIGSSWKGPEWFLHSLHQGDIKGHQSSFLLWKFQSQYHHPNISLPPVPS